MNLIIKGFFFYIIVILFGCSSPSDNKIPKDLIDPKKMENILVDIELLRAIKSTNASDKDKENNLGDLYLYKKYDIDSLQLLESKKHYSKNPKQYVLIYEAVENKLKFLKDSLNNLGEKINQVD